MDFAKDSEGNGLDEDWHQKRKQEDGLTREEIWTGRQVERQVGKGLGKGWSVFGQVGPVAMECEETRLFSKDNSKRAQLRGRTTKRRSWTGVDDGEHEDAGERKGVDTGGKGHVMKPRT